MEHSVPIPVVSSMMQTASRAETEEIEAAAAAANRNARENILKNYVCVRLR